MGIKKQEIEQQKINRLGEVRKNKQGSEMKIIEYYGARNITVQFQDLHRYTIKTNYPLFKKGEVKNPYFPSVCGVGSIGNTITMGESNRQKDSYNRWQHMLKRCYNKEFKKKHPTYLLSKTQEDWLCFENFEKWYEKNYYECGNEKMCLDKDILIKGNKIYSPETCIFVPQLINGLFLKSDKTRGELPIGVQRIKVKISQNCYASIVFDKFGKKHIIAFSSIEEAFSTYKGSKEKNIKRIADEYKLKYPNFPKRLYDAMYNYKVEITD